MNVLWQALGLVVCIAAGLATGWIIAAIFKARGGVAVSEDTQVAGFDARYWEIVHDLEPNGADGVPVQATPATVDGPGNGVEATQRPTSPA